MSKLSTLTPIAAVLALSVAGVSHAADTPFAAKPVTQAVTVADNHEGKCGADKAKGEGKCGADKMEKMKKEGKCGEGKCGADKAGAEGKCGADKMEKMKKEGKCGEGKCGADKAKAAPAAK